jgi:hypothetical protein
MVQSQPRQIVRDTLSQNKLNTKQGCTGGVAHKVECLPSKHAALSSNCSSSSTTKKRIDKWDCIRLKCFLTAKETAEGRQQLENGRKVYSSDKRLMSRIYKELKKKSNLISKIDK